MKSEAARHHKMTDLAEFLNVNHAHAVGIVFLLFDFVATTYPRGEFPRAAAKALAHHARYARGPEKLTRALCDAGWLQVSDSGMLQVHDWPQHCEDYVHKRLSRSGQTFYDGTVPFNRRNQSEQSPSADQSPTSQSPDKVQTVTGSRARGSMPCLAVPFHALPSGANIDPSREAEPGPEATSGPEAEQAPPVPSPAAPGNISEQQFPDPEPVKPKPSKSKRRAPPAYTEAFEAFYGEYPRHRLSYKPTVFQAWQEANAETDAPAVMDALAKDKRSGAWAREGGSYVPNAERWLSRKLWTRGDDPEEGICRSFDPVSF
jgi:hypothetical protein